MDLLALSVLIVSQQRLVVLKATKSPYGASQKKKTLKFCNWPSLALEGNI